MNGRANSVITIMVACQALEAIMTIMKYQVEQLYKIGVAVFFLRNEVSEANLNKKKRII